MSRTEQWQKLLDSYHDMNHNSQAARLGRFGVLIEQYDHLLSKQRENSDFNLFQLLGVVHDELTHSRILSWLLNARAPHASNRLIAEAFCSAFGFTLPVDVGGNYKVRTEVAGHQSRIDILAYYPGSFIVGVDNKILAWESYRQAEREYEDLEALSFHLHVTPHNLYAVFLSLDGRAPETAAGTPWKPLSYTAFFSVLQPMLSKLPNPKTRVFIEDWIQALRTLIEEESHDVSVE